MRGEGGAGVIRGSLVIKYTIMDVNRIDEVRDRASGRQRGKQDLSRLKGFRVSDFSQGVRRRVGI